jgi:PEP-CTERM motif
MSRAVLRSIGVHAARGQDGGCLGLRPRGQDGGCLGLPPSIPILAGEPFTSPIFLADLSLPVFGSDTVALDSAPTDLFPESWSITSVPEPSTLVLAAIGMGGMIAYARHMSKTPISAVIPAA